MASFVISSFIICTFFQKCNASVCKLIGWRECQNFNDNEKLSREEREELCYIGCSEFTQCLIFRDKKKRKKEISCCHVS